MQDVEQARFERIEALFHQASALDPVDQGRFLAQACDGDQATRREVESLLAATPLALDEVDALTQGAAPTPGDRVGAYRLESKIGEGGSSVVFRAWRTDQRFDKAVAIKIRKPGQGWWPGPDRFAVECRILARLEHPSIARLYDAGSLPSGEPYVVMELVPGERITDYCDHLRLTIGQRLALFRQVCDAVDYAHRRLIVHRDLKPSNILVANSQPKLLDFGIAKLLEPADPDRIDATVTALQPMTPQYASPEQILGEPVGIASDVYALGLLLFELLVGALPYRFAGRHLGELDQMLAQLDRLPSPSSVASRGDGAEDRALARGCTVEGLRSRIGGDLDAIIAKALRREAESRYATAAEFSADLERHVVGHPVRARAGSFSYRTRRYVRRHRWGLAATLVVFSLVVGLAAAIARQSVLVRQERDRARTVSDFVTDLFEVYNPDAVNEAATVRSLLDQGARQIDADPRLSTDERATLLDTLGVLYRRIGAAEAGLAATERALQLRRERFGLQHADIATSLFHWAESLSVIGQWDAALLRYREALLMQRRVHGDHHWSVAQTLSRLAEVQSSRGEFEEAERLFRRAESIWRRQSVGDARPQHAETLSGLGAQLSFLGRFEEAEPLLESALEIKREWYEPSHPAVVRALMDLAELRHQRGEFTRAEQMYRQALEMLRRYRDESDLSLHSCLNGLGRALEFQGRLAEAEAVLRERADLTGRHRGTRHPEYATAQNNLAAVLRGLGRLDEAEDRYREALDIRLEVLGEKHHYVAQSRFSLGLLLHQRGELAAALVLFERAESGADASNLPPGHIARSYLKVGRGRVLIDLERAAAAEPILRDGLAIARAVLPDDHWRIADAESALGGALAALGRGAESRPLLTGGLEALTVLEGPGSWRVTWTERWLESLDTLPPSDSSSE